MRAVSELLGVGTMETVRKWVRQAEIDDGSCWGIDRESAELKRLKRENAELKRANAILKTASASSRPTGPATSLIVRFIGEHQGRRGAGGLRWGVEVDLRRAG